MIGELVLPPQIHEGLHNGQRIRTVTYPGTYTAHDTIQDIPLPLGHHPMGIQTTMPIGRAMIGAYATTYAFAHQS